MNTRCMAPDVVVGDDARTETYVPGDTNTVLVSVIGADGRGAVVMHCTDEGVLVLLEGLLKARREAKRGNRDELGNG